MSLSLAYSQRLITPDLNRPIYLAGAENNRRATGIRDGLEIRALSLKSEKDHILLITLDLYGLPANHCTEVIARIQQYVGDNVQILIACSGTLGSPDFVGAWGKTATESGIDPDTLTSLKGQIVLTAIETSRQPHSAVELGEIRTSDIDCLQFRRLDGTPYATLAMAPTSASTEQDTYTLISAGDIGELRQAIEKQLGAPTLVLCDGLAPAQKPTVINGWHVIPSTIGYRSTSLKLPVEKETFRIAVLQGTLPEAIDKDGFVETSVGLLTLGAKHWVTLPIMVPKDVLPFKALCLINDALIYSSDGRFLPSSDALDRILQAAERLYNNRYESS